MVRITGPQDRGPGKRVPIIGMLALAYVLHYLWTMGIKEELEALRNTGTGRVKAHASSTYSSATTAFSSPEAEAKRRKQKELEEKQSRLDALEKMHKGGTGYMNLLYKKLIDDQRKWTQFGNREDGGGSGINNGSFNGGIDHEKGMGVGVSETDVSMLPEHVIKALMAKYETNDAVNALSHALEDEVDGKGVLAELMEVTTPTSTDDVTKKDGPSEEAINNEVQERKAEEERLERESRLKKEEEEETKLKAAAAEEELRRARIAVEEARAKEEETMRLRAKAEEALLAVKEAKTREEEAIRLRDEIEDMKQSEIVKLMAQIEALKNEIKTMKQTHDVELNDIGSSHKKEMDQLRNEFEKRSTKLTALHEAEIENLKQELEKCAEAVKAAKEEVAAAAKFDNSDYEWAPKTTAEIRQLINTMADDLDRDAGYYEGSILESLFHGKGEILFRRLVDINMAFVC